MVPGSHNLEVFCPEEADLTLSFSGDYVPLPDGLRPVPIDLDPGDVLFFEGLGHVGLHVGQGRMVHAPYTGSNLEVVSLASWSGHFVGAPRVFLTTPS